jgi:membrane fusion protein (multidrug efflux system)
MELQGLYSVYVVDESNKVHKRDVSVGIKTGQFWLIKEGLKPNEKVVYEGLQKVKNGAAVTATVVEPKLATQESK